MKKKLVSLCLITLLMMQSNYVFASVEEPNSLNTEKTILSENIIVSDPMLSETLEQTEGFVPSNTYNTENNDNYASNSSIIFNPDDSFICNSEVIFEQGNDVVTTIPSINSSLLNDESNSVANTTSSVTTTAPIVDNLSSLRIDNSSITGIRFRATATSEQRSSAVEYGFLIGITANLEAKNVELTLDLTEVAFVKGVAYNKESGIDNIYSITGDGDYIYTGVLTGIPVSRYTSYLSARSYIIYEVDGEQIVSYGNTHSASIYRTAKSMDLQYESEEIAETITTMIETVDNSVSLSTATTVNISVETTRTIGADPDVDIIKFTPTTGNVYYVNFNGASGTTYSLLNADGTYLEAVATSHFSLAANTDYYVRIRGQRNSTYTISFAIPATSTSISCTNETIYNIIVSDYNIPPKGEKTYSLVYDASVFSLEDCCSFTYAKELDEGEINETGITIISIRSGIITFKISNNYNHLISGAINSIKLNCIFDGNSTIFLHTNNS